MNRYALYLTMLAAAGCSKKLDNSKVEASIKSGLEAKNVKVESVSCPSDKSPKKGDTFDCTGKAGGKPFTVKVEQTDDNGAVKWTLKGYAVDSKAVVAKIGPELAKGTGATLTCADVPVTIETGPYKLDCELKNPDAKIQIVFAADGSMSAVPVGGAADEPKPDEAKHDEAKHDEPKADEPKADEPKADEQAAPQ